MTLESLRQTRIYGYAIFDLVVTFIGMGIFSPFLSWLFRLMKVYIPKINWLILALPIGIITHLMVGQKTLMVKDFMDMNNHYILKAVIIVLLILGIRGIKILKK